MSVNRDTFWNTVIKHSYQIKDNWQLKISLDLMRKLLWFGNIFLRSEIGYSFVRSKCSNAQTNASFIIIIKSFTKKCIQEKQKTLYTSLSMIIWKVYLCVNLTDYIHYFSAFLPFLTSFYSYSLTWTLSKKLWELK